MTELGEPFGIDPADQFAIDQSRRAERAVSEAIDRLDRDRARAGVGIDGDAMILRKAADQGFAAQRLAGLGTAELDDAMRLRSRPEVVVERDRAMHLRTGEVQRIGVTDPLSLAEYEAHGGLVGLKAALGITGAEIVEAVKASGLRGRGGAGFPTGIKWKTVHDAQAEQKYIVCNADEGDSGTFADRMLIEGDPFLLIEGMVIAGVAVGATRGYVYLRSEYPHAYRAMQRAILKAGNAGILGHSVLGTGHAFHLEVRLGAGA